MMHHLIYNENQMLQKSQNHLTFEFRLSIVQKSYMVFFTGLIKSLTKQARMWTASEAEKKNKGCVRQQEETVAAAAYSVLLRAKKHSRCSKAVFGG